MLNDEIYTRYLNGMTPSEIAEHLKEILPEFGDLNVEEVLLMQESVLSHIENNKRSVAFDSGQTSNRSLLSAHASDHGASDESQLALDEALARSLQDDFDDLHICEYGDSASDRGSASRERQNQHIQQDDIDPDRMTYEELQSLGEEVGSESKGLPVDLISRLPTFKYKTGIGLFKLKKKKEKEQCVICCVDYKNGVVLTTLPCAHNYHSDCINTWLQLKKHCPVCQKEVEAEAD